MQLKKLNDEVLIAGDIIAQLARPDVESLKKQSLLNERRRIRICTHNQIDDPLHEMFIVHQRDAYVRPHKHLNKSESVHIIEGAVDVVLFDEGGDVMEVIQMGDYRSGRRFYYRISEPRYHTLLITSECLVFHEITNGPFNKADTVFARWAPEEGDLAGREEFMRRVRRAAGGSVGES